MPQIKVILCPVDLSEPSCKAAAYAQLLAQKLKARLVVLYVTSDYLDDNPAAGEAWEKPPDPESVRLLREFAAESFGRLAADSLVLSGPVSETILEAAARIKADLIIMGTHGRKGLDRLMFGSVAERIVKESSIPIMTIRP